MDRIVEVSGMENWRAATDDLGRNGVVANVWQIRTAAEASEDFELINQGFKYVSPGYAYPASIPQIIVEAAHDVAMKAGRLPEDDVAKIKRLPAVFGTGHDITGLHTDINFSDDGAQSPVYSTFYVAEGAIRGYFKSLPLELLEPGNDLRDELFDGLDEASNKTHNGLRIQEAAKDLFQVIEAGAGSIISFPSAGSFERGIAPSAHQVESITPVRKTIVLPDQVFMAPRSLNGL